MKLKLVRNVKMPQHNPDLFRFVNMIVDYAHKRITGGSKAQNQQFYFSEDEYESIDRSLHIDFLKSEKDKYKDHSDPVEMVIFIDNEPIFSENSLPVIIFSLDQLIEEKIEMLDAEILDEKTISIMQRLLVRINNNRNLLQEALKRHYSKENFTKNKNSPLW